MTQKNKLLYPAYLESSNLFRETLTSENSEVSRLNDIVGIFMNELSPNMAKEWLSEWEEMMNIPHTPDQPTDERQSIIISRLRSSGTLSRSRLKEIALSFKNGEVEFVEDTSNYSFIVKFISTLGKPPNFDDFMKAVEEVIPAHLRVDYEFTFNTNGFLSKYSYGQMNKYRHQQLRNEVQ